MVAVRARPSTSTIGRIESFMVVDLSGWSRWRMGPATRSTFLLKYPQSRWVTGERERAGAFREMKNHTYFRSQN